MKSTTAFLTTLLACAISAQAQNTQALFSDFYDAFDQSKSRMQDKYRSYVDSIDIKFAEYLSQPWMNFIPEQPLALPAKPGPVKMPEYTPDSAAPKETVIPSLTPDTAIISKPQSKEELYIYQSEEAEAKGVSFSFFGSPTFVPVPDRAYNARLPSINERQVADYWKQLLKSDYDKLLKSLMLKKTALNLNAWGYYRLVSGFADTYYSGRQENEKAIFTVFVLNMSGYKAKIGLFDNSLVVLLAIRNNVYGKAFVRFNNETYYVLTDRDTAGKPVSSYLLGYARATEKIDLASADIPLLPEKIQTITRKHNGKSYRYRCNANLVDFYSSFPQTDLHVYANMPLSADALKSLDEALAPLLEKKDATDRLRLLLSLIQEGFEYKKDEDVFGHEHFAFADETLLLPYSDCEDRAILFGRLVKHFCRLDVLLVDYPTHVATAVRSDEPGDAIRYNNIRYIICDPSFRGAPIAKTMTGQDNAAAQIIPVL
jgi:hypothetical protein